MKILRPIALLSFLALLMGGLYWPLSRLSNPVQTGTPLPYVLRANYAGEARRAEKSNILLVGDRLGAKLAPFLDALVRETQGRLAEPLTVYNWAREGEGLHRTLAKIKSLRRMPEVIIYHGGSQEFFEQRLMPQFYPAILSNYQAHQNPKNRELIKSWGQLSKFIYTPHPRVQLKQTYSPLSKARPHQQNQRMMELTYLTFSAEYREFVEGLKRRRAKVIVIPPAHNLDVAPRATCQNSSTGEQRERIEAIVEHIRGGRAPAAIPQLQDILSRSHGNALAYYWLGQALKHTGHFKDAKSLLYRAMLFDCWPFRGNMIFNRIQTQLAEQGQFQVIDFNRLVNRKFGQRDSSQTLFADDIFPRDIFYRQLVQGLIKKVENILKI